MNCYYHSDISSEATCVDCGKGLCQECAGRYEIPICNECNEKRSKAEKQAVIRQYIPSVLFFIAGLVISLRVGNNIIVSLMYGYIFAGIFWGWKVITFIQPKMFLFLSLFGWMIYFMIKFILSLFAGIVAMPVGIVRIILRHINANAKGKNIEKNKQI
jgi:hypothetical protein